MGKLVKIDYARLKDGSLPRVVDDGDRNSRTAGMRPGKGSVQYGC